MADPKMTMDVLVTCTRPGSIRRCLESLAKQSRTPDTVITVARDTDKESREEIDIFNKEHNLNIKKIIISEPGVIAATNAGIDASGGDILCFIDDDARARPDWLERIGNYYKDNQAGGVGGRDIVHSDGGIIEKHADEIGVVTWYGRTIGNHHDIAEKARRVNFLKGCNMSFRRKLISRIDDKLKAGSAVAEPCWEIDMSYGVTGKGYDIWYEPEIVVDHYPGEKDFHVDARSLVAIRNETYILLKYLSPPKKAIFLLYTFIIGNRGNPGAILALLSLITLNYKELSMLKDKFLSKMEGVALWWGRRGGLNLLYDGRSSAS